MAAGSGLSGLRSRRAGRVFNHQPATIKSLIYPTIYKPAFQGLTNPQPIKRKPMNSKDFNKEWIVRVDWQEIHTLLGYSSLVTLLDDCAEKMLNRLNAYKGDKLVVRPFHGAVITFYRH